MPLKFQDNSINIVAYHYVREIKQSNFPNLKGIELNLFKKQIKFFKKNFIMISAEELNYLIKHKTKANFKKPLMLLTFDDGYLDHFKYVLPLLIKEKISGCFYPPIKIFKKKILKVNKLQFILSVTNDKRELINEIINYLKKKKIRTNLLNKKRLHNYKIPEYDDNETILIKKILYKETTEHISNKICNFLFKKYIKTDQDKFSKNLYMSISNLKELENNNMHIGSHGTNHIMFKNLSDTKQKNEITKSLIFFKNNNIDIANISLCYPWGSYNQNSKKILKKLNINFALTSNSGNIMLNKKFDRYYLPRFDANEFKNI